MTANQALVVTTTAAPAAPSPTRPLPASPVRAGWREASSVAIAYVPFALALGATLALATGRPLLAWSTSPLLFGGAAQLVAVRLLASGAGAAVIVVSALIVNARLLLYSASLAPHAREWSARSRWAGAYLLIDPVYALAMNRYSDPHRRGDARERRVYYTTVGLVLWTTWQLTTGAGVLLARVLPSSLRLEFAAPLTFLLLLLPMLASRAAYAAAATGGAVAMAAHGLPLGLGLLTGAAAGIVAGAFTATTAGRGRA